MNIKDLSDYATLAGALTAAVAAVWNLMLQVRGKRDRFIVRLGSMSPTIEPEMMLTVVSCCDHPIRLTDWGFIEANGKFTSFMLEWETGDLTGDEVSSRGSPRLDNFGQHFETGYVRLGMPLGAYAISATQHHPSIIFDAGVSIWNRLWIRSRLVVQPDYLCW